MPVTDAPAVFAAASASARMPLADSALAFSRSAMIELVSTIMISAPGASTMDGSVTVTAVTLPPVLAARPSACRSAFVLNSEPSTAQTMLEYMANSFAP
ncbi:hypothetical protein D3C87_1827040 [compost metagenome]